MDTIQHVLAILNVMSVSCDEMNLKPNNKNFFIRLCISHCMMSYLFKVCDKNFIESTRAGYGRTIYVHKDVI